jgi:mRNA-degrading endonuclease HigB of HigAB toxin-antitoxin module
LHVISRKELKEAVARHSDLESPLDSGYASQNVLRGKIWPLFCRAFSSADAVAKWTVLNVVGINTG